MSEQEKKLPIRCIVAGGRDFNNYKLLRKKLDKIFYDTLPDDIVIISGGARGADHCGEAYAVERGLQLEVMPADWDKYGRSAGHIRNREMAKVATHCVVFWDGQSSGSRNMIELAELYELELRVIRYINT